MRWVAVAVLLVTTSCDSQEVWQGQLTQCGGGARGQQDVKLVLDFPAIPLPGGTFSQKVTNNFVDAAIHDGESTPAGLRFKADFNGLQEKWDVNLTKSGPAASRGSARIDVPSNTINCTMELTRE